ncbi:MAG: hypothetical protein KDE31_20355, partial [Caldilineaceae bacterium]|nr:hypothetical protein [Caldilineaceae bacterium]
RSAQEGMLVVSENWMPGWRVDSFTCLSPSPPCARTTSGDELPLLTALRTDLTFIGLVIPAGEMTFTLRYQPMSVYLGLTISGATALLLLIVCLWRWRRRVTR